MSLEIDCFKWKALYIVIFFVHNESSNANLYRILNIVAATTIKILDIISQW